MTKKLFIAGIVLILAAAAALAADAVTGKWVMAQEFNGNSMTTTFDLKADGAKLTGTASMPGMDGQNTSAAISNGKVDGNNVSFDVVRDFGGNSFTMKYEGTVSGSEMKIKMTFPGFGGGEARTFEATAKKSGS